MTKDNIAFAFSERAGLVKLPKARLLSHLDSSV